MSKKQKNISGYEVRTPDLEVIGFCGQSIEECKRWCYGNRVIVSTYRKKIAFKICVTFGRRYWWYHYSKWSKTLDLAWLTIHWEWIYTNEPLEIVWRNES